MTWWELLTGIVCPSQNRLGQSPYDSRNLLTGKDFPHLGMLTPVWSIPIISGL